ncbi:hypothetical protein MPSEU_001027700 [Mayamaea pseudoterrestris]|nr:hypothetical protein MPSEU_001027700 [Mayamaea pseudoterrestris]
MKLMKQFLSLVASATLASAVTENVAAKVLAKRTLEASKLINLVAEEPLPHSNRLLQLKLPQTYQRSSSNNNHHLRSLESTSDTLTCDAAFMNCLEVSQCVDCFLQLQTRDIDWASVTQDTPCSDVVSFLNNNQLCMNVKKSTASMDQFCQTFDSCVNWDDDDGYKNGDDENNSQRGSDDDVQPYVDCSKLTKCEWEGFHPSFIGNGICNDGIYGCYNTEVCGWDGGDCCEDTCERESNYLECGHDGYFCRDPESKNCNSWYSTNCNSAIVVNDDILSDDALNMECSSEETSYRLIMYDSFGDGWDATKLSLYNVDEKDPIYTGSLKSGSQGTHWVCLSKNPSCYQVKVNGGTWGNEVSWEVRPRMDSPAIAGGGAPMDCRFPVAGYTGRDCQLTCEGKPNLKPSDDPDYKEMKDLFHCIEDKCMIQQGVCDRNDVCKGCFNQEGETEDYCFANDAFNALVDCSLCKCTSKGEDSSYCASKLSPGKTYPSPGQQDKKSSSLPDCSPTETLKGGAAVMAFNTCSNIDQISMMVTDFDQNNFGDWDKKHEQGTG